MRLLTIIGFALLSCQGLNINADANPTENHSLMQQSENISQATFGSGCFWCSDAIFSRLRGVQSVTVGYSGGLLTEPTYEQVKTGTTGHAEVIRIEFNPDEISFVRLLEVFFKTHDPTTLNRQGADVGTQYRSVIFYHDQQQKEMAERILESLDKAGIWENPIVTEISPLTNFYEAEAYHRNYFTNNPGQAYCNLVILPKVKKFEALFNDLLKE